MQLPGESVIVRFWESVEKLSIGALKPYQQNRLDDQRRKSELAEAIHKSKLEQVTKDLQLLRDSESVPAQVVGALEAVAEQRIREEHNAMSSIAYAYEHLQSSDDKTCDDKDVDTDWLNRWYSYASKVTNDELRQIWGKVLAGEVRNVNSVPYRTMDFIDKLTAKEVDEVSILLSMVELGQNKLIFRGKDKVKEYLASKNITPDVIQKYGTIGLLGPSTTGAVGIYTQLDFTKYDFFDFVYSGNKLRLTLNQANREKIVATYYDLGDIGKSLVQLSDYGDNQEYIQALIQDFSEQNIIAVQTNNLS